MISCKFRKNIDPRVERIGLPEEKAVTKAEDKSPPKGKEDTYKDRFGRGEEYWKSSSRRVEEEVEDGPGKS